MPDPLVNTREGAQARSQAGVSAMGVIRTHHLDELLALCGRRLHGADLDGPRVSIAPKG